MTMTMMSDGTNVAALANRPTRRQAIVAVAMASSGLTLGSTKAWAGAEDEISHTAESIHQEPIIKTGRHVELVPNERIVQAWRTGSWAPGVYSIAKFEFVEQGSGTKIVFDHTGFPKGQAEVLASGWKAHYWEPIEKLLA